MAKKKFGSNWHRERSSENQFDNSHMDQQYRMLGQQVPPKSINRIHLPAPIQFHNRNQFLIPTPHMWLPAPNPNFLPTPQISTLNHLSLATPHMWLPVPNPNNVAYQGVRGPFVCLAPHPAHPPHPNRFALQPVHVSRHSYLIQSHPPYVRGCPVSSRPHALHNGGIVPRFPSHQLPQNCPFIPYLSGPVRIRGQIFNSAPPFHTRYPPIGGCQFEPRITDSRMSTTSALQADDADHSAPPFHARDTPTVQTPTEGCQRDVSSLPRATYFELTATSASQANHADPTQNHSSTPTKAAVAEKVLVASITADEKTVNEKNWAPGLVTSNQFVLQWLGGTKIEILKSPDSAAILCELPTNESVFYEWWEVAPSSSHPQSILASLGLEVRERWDGLNLMLEGLSDSSNDTPSWDGLNMMLEGLSESSDDAPSSPRSVMVSENLEKYSKEGSDVTETSIVQLQKMLGITLGNPSDISCIMSSLFDVGAELTEDLTEELTAKKK